MLKPDFTKYSLALIQGDKIIYSSQGNGLKPLWDCLENYRQTKDSFILYDKVIGLAAAKLIVYSKIISEIQTLLVSQPAKKFLEENKIPLKAKNTVANIFTKDRQSICPGEIIALNIDEPGVFSAKIKKMLSNL
ncbi:DUF1893 domain-containing protein [Candidatus Bathyarchaeota archaeon]|nr:DUF1893 domain-containing protein [Candidatus Bathyarchaeota archaeon]